MCRTLLPATPASSSRSPRNFREQGSGSTRVLGFRAYSGSGLKTLESWFRRRAFRSHKLSTLPVSILVGIEQ